MYSFRKFLISVNTFVLLLLANCATPSFKDFVSPDEKSIQFAAVGDIMVHATQLTSAYNSQCKCYNFHPVFAEVKDTISKADIAFGNLETTLPGDSKLFAGYPQFGAPDELAKALKDTGFDILTTSNNHSVDTGRKGIDHTIETLDQLGILHLGTYRSLDEFEKNRLLTVKINDIKIILLSYSYSTNGIAIPKDKVVNLIEKDRIREDIELARKAKPDLVLVAYHFGTEYARYPDKFQKEMVEFAFQEGADIVLGGHPHVLQQYEVDWIQDKYGEKKQRMVIYSLGNFVSGQIKRYTNGGIIFNFRLTKKSIMGKPQILIHDINYIPVFVYVSNEKNGFQYNVLPVEKYLKNDQPLKLTPTAYRSMLEFYEDTKTHLQKNSLVGVNDFR
ncbi:MAG TPA: CapA family protein [Leptospiraceae bacterium]|nr:CapA family protein [Leptospiraceae bacterium]HMW04082.1 CapA family protein [Leptospiraceae bacterium]HMX30851.1 CapA family protein [Leptospiraceae bacterium]HMY30076.1 CapA family protein [Leptospiraceae bacterium]HMZ62737.1 CapA family protein [Leptospiraceae bacterium]